MRVRFGFCWQPWAFMNNAYILVCLRRLMPMFNQRTLAHAQPGSRQMSRGLDIGSSTRLRPSSGMPTEKTKKKKKKKICNAVHVHVLGKSWPNGLTCIEDCRLRLS